MAKYTIYTDGACSGNPGPGGWGAIILHEDGTESVTLCGGEEYTTNNRQELMGVIAGLKYLFKKADTTEVVIITDSSYVSKAFNENWIGNWQRNGWVTSTKKPVENQDLWLELLRLKQAFARVEFRWVKGHAQNEYNNKCDKIARGEVKRIQAAME